MAAILKPDLWNVQSAYVDPDWQWAWRGLVWAAAPGGKWHHDLIGGNMGTLLTSGDWHGTSRHGLSLSSTSTTNGGAYWLYHDRILSLTRSYTIIVWADPSSGGLVDSSKLLCIPYRVNTWVSPWVAISLGRDGATTGGASDYASDGSTNISVVSSTGFIQDTDPLTMYAFTRNGAAGAFYRNAAAWGTGTFSSNLNVDWTNKQPVVLLNHSNSSNGEGMNGTAPLAMLYNRALSPREIKALYINPYGFMEMPLIQKFYPFPVPPPVYEQEGFRWRNDDGSETTATWKASQDTNTSVAKLTNIRLRMLVNSTHNTPSRNYKLQYRKVGVASWRDVP